MRSQLLRSLRLGVLTAAVAVTVPTACSSGGSSGGAAVCSGSPASEGVGWNLGRAAIDPDAAARAAVFMASCVPDDNPNITLLDYYISRSDGAAASLDQLACLASKKNGCQAVNECLGLTVSIQPQCAESFTCNGNVLVGCSDDLVYHLDCSKAGGVAKCDPEAWCAPCEGTATTPTCDDQTFTDHCEDGRPVRCRYGYVTRGPRCADLGLECQPNSSGTYVGCYGSGAQCSANWGGNGLLAGIGCTGNVLNACVGDKSFDIECGQVGAGFTCQAFATDFETSYFCGVAAECDGAANPPEDPTCDGSSLVLCNAGRIEKVDCLALGFTGCAAEWGRCVPGPYAQL
jgi:hypothetical protein